VSAPLEVVRRTHHADGKEWICRHNGHFARRTRSPAVSANFSSGVKQTQNNDLDYFTALGTGC
jgi:hypothetical protein